MSADNMIAILATKGPQFRVAHIQSPENFLNQNLTNKQTEAMFVYTFGLSRVFQNQNDALLHADKIEELVGYVEYGVATFNYPDVDFEKLMSMEDAENLDWE